MEEVKDLTRKLHPEFVIIESGGDNLAANYSRELADYIIYVIDVAGKYPFPSPLSDHYTLRPSIFLPPAPPPTPSDLANLPPSPPWQSPACRVCPSCPTPTPLGFNQHITHSMSSKSIPPQYMPLSTPQSPFLPPLGTPLPVSPF